MKIILALLLFVFNVCHIDTIFASDENNINKEDGQINNLATNIHKDNINEIIKLQAEHMWHNKDLIKEIKDKKKQLENTLAIIQKQHKDIETYFFFINTTIVIIIFIILVLHYYWIKKFNSIKKISSLAQEKFDQIDNIKKISYFRFLVEDYQKLVLREWEKSKGENEILVIKWKQVIEEYDKIKYIIDKIEPYHLNFVAYAYFELKIYDEAMKMLDISKKIDPHNSFTHYALWYVSETLYNNSTKEEEKQIFLKDTIRHIQNAVHLEPFNVNYLIYLWFTNVIKWDFDKAYNLFIKAIDYNISKSRNLFKIWNDSEYARFFKTDKWQEILKKLNIEFV